MITQQQQQQQQQQIRKEIQEKDIHIRVATTVNSFRLCTSAHFTVPLRR